MARKNYAIREATIRSFVGQGRGQGYGADYQPWLTIRDVPSLGRSHRAWGITTGRVHHTLSDGEDNLRLFLEADPNTIDYREQYPMDRWETYQAALDLGYPPALTIDGTPQVLTIDALVTQRIDGRIVDRPLTFKYSYDQLSERQHQLLEIATLYCERRGLRLEIVNETFYDVDLCRKWCQLRPFHRIDHLRDMDHGLVQKVAADFGRAVVQMDHERLARYCDNAGRRLRVPGSRVYDVIRHLLATRVLVTDLTGPLRLEQYRLNQFRLALKG